MTILRALALFAFLVAVALVAYLSLAPGGTVPQSNQIDKPLHILGYGFVMLTAGVAFPTWRARYGAIIGLTLYGAGIEWLQGDIPQHQTSGLDMLANLVGLGLACLALWVGDRLGLLTAPAATLRWYRDANAPRTTPTPQSNPETTAAVSRQPSHQAAVTTMPQSEPDKDASRPPVRHPDPFLDSFLKRLDPDVAAGFTEAQLRAIKLSFGAQVRQRHPLDIRRSVLLFNRRYYVILIAGRERRALERLRREGMTSRLLDTLAIGVGILVVAVPTILLGAWVLGGLGIDILPTDTGALWRDLVDQFTQMF